MSDEKPAAYWKEIAEAYYERAIHAESQCRLMIDQCNTLNKRLKLTYAVLGYASSALNRCEAWVRPKRAWVKVFKDMAQAVDKYSKGTATNDTMRVFGLEERE